MDILSVLGIVLIVTAGCLVAYGFHLRNKERILEINKKGDENNQEFGKQLDEDYKMICYLTVKLKFYDAVYNKYLAEVPGGAYSIQQQDKDLFDENELEYLNQHIDDLKRLYEIQRGKNKILNAFRNPL